jgi:subtilisin family serine protease
MQYANQGTNVIDTSQTAQDDHGHGTHVAGIIAARGNNGIDVAGVGWRTRIIPVKVLNGAGRIVGVSIAQGIAWAATRCSILNLSIQGAVDDAALRSALDGAQRLGVLVVAAMGNFGWDETRPSFPAAYARTHDNVIAVGAVDRQHKRSVWSSTQSSNTGSWIGLAAPGTNIDSTSLGGGVKQKSGTSQACPHVAGTAALVRAVAPGLTAQQVITLLKNTAGPLRDGIVRLFGG